MRNETTIKHENTKLNVGTKHKQRNNETQKGCASCYPLFEESRTRSTKKKKENKTRKPDTMNTKTEEE